MYNINAFNRFYVRNTSISTIAFFLVRFIINPLLGYYDKITLFIKNDKTTFQQTIYIYQGGGEINIIKRMFFFLTYVFLSFTKEFIIEYLKKKKILFCTFLLNWYFSFRFLYYIGT